MIQEEQANAALNVLREYVKQKAVVDKNESRDYAKWVAQELLDASSARHDCPTCGG